MEWRSKFRLSWIATLLEWKFSIHLILADSPVAADVKLTTPTDVDWPGAVRLVAKAKNIKLRIC